MRLYQAAWNAHTEFDPNEPVANTPGDILGYTDGIIDPESVKCVTINEFSLHLSMAGQLVQTLVVVHSLRKFRNSVRCRPLTDETIAPMNFTPFMTGDVYGRVNAKTRATFNRSYPPSALRAIAAPNGREPMIKYLIYCELVESGVIDGAGRPLRVQTSQQIGDAVLVCHRDRPGLQDSPPA
jgi:hypothetical protein